MQTTKVYLVIIFLISAFVINTLFSFQLGDGGEEKFRWVNHTHNVIFKSEILLRSITDLETGQRGYLLTQDETYLKPYIKALSGVEKSFKDLQTLTLDNHIQQKRLSSVEKFMKLKLSELKATINFNKSGQFNKALDLIKKDQGKYYMDKIRLLLDTFISEEKKLLKKRETALKKQTASNILMVRLISTFLLSILFFFIYRTLNQKHTLKLANFKAVNALEAKSSFLANMSHEIRTPLNAILGFINILKSKVEDKTSLAYLDIIDNSSHSLLNVIEDILDFSKIEKGKLDIDKIDFDTRKEFEIITHLFDAKCSEKDITLHLNFDQTLPHYLHSDPLRIKQVISNLLSNAIKFTDSGKSIFISIAHSDSLLTISVEDEGKGIAKNKLNHIFTAFGQEDSSTTRNYGGTGLGLSISQNLVDLLGGSIQVQSELNKGSTFSFSIPAEIAQAPHVPVIEKEGDPLNGTVLLVEDNKTNQLLMKITLLELKLQYDIANDGLEAIEFFKKNQYDAILMDENMPNMGGIEATSHILDIEKEEQRKHTPIVALTANALKGDRERFLNAGMDEYRSKPLSPEDLYEVLSIVMNPQDS